MKQFNSLRQFTRHLAQIAPAVNRAATAGLHEGARMVQRQAQHELGIYQGEAGPFGAWPELAESTLMGIDDNKGHHPGKIAAGFAPPDNPGLATGALHDAIEITLQAHEAAIGVPDEQAGSGVPYDENRNLGDVAVDFELGTVKQPARSFLGRAGFIEAPKVVELIGHAVVTAMTGTAHRAPAKGQGLEDIPF